MEQFSQIECGVGVEKLHKKHSNLGLLGLQSILSYTPLSVCYKIRLCLGFLTLLKLGGWGRFCPSYMYVCGGSTLKFVKSEGHEVCKSKLLHLEAT